MGQHLQPDHGRGDANTLGGYMAVHDRPAAFEGSDGFSYSVEILVDDLGGTGEWGGYLLFVQWARVGASSPMGHLESDFLSRAGTPVAARDAVERLPLSEVRSVLDALIALRDAGTTRRKWWDAMRADDSE
jgi:hypothetical protein